MNSITVDLDRLNEDLYMEALTSTHSWNRLYLYILSLQIENIMVALRSEGASEDVRHIVVDALLKDLSPEDRRTLASVINVSDFLDTLVLTMNKKKLAQQ